MAYRRFIIDLINIPELKDFIMKSSKDRRRKKNHRNNKAVMSIDLLFDI